jgi:amidase
MSDEQTFVSDPICFMSAVELAARIRTRSLSAKEVMQVFLDQIDRLNPELNAIPTRIPAEQALLLAKAADTRLARGEQPGPLHGLPIAIKDLADVAGMHTSMGSPLFNDYYPQRDSLFVERIRRAGALIIGKTNVPEFGAGSHTFNTVFGATRNPYNTKKSAGGSSGGAAVSLATGMLPLADGSDMGGSLRNPAAFNNVFAIRPSMGRVPSNAVNTGWMTRHATVGPMARNVNDACLLMSVMAGHDPVDPLSIRETGDQFLAPLERDFKGSRVAWGGDMGCMAVEPEILDICERSLQVLRNMGIVVDDDRPDLSDAMDVFQVQRAMGNTQTIKVLEALDPNWRARVKDTILWNIDKGLNLTQAEIVRSDVIRSQIYQRMLGFFAHHDFLVLPSTQVPPFDIELDWVHEIDGHQMETYIDWMAACCIITVTGCPAASVPCGFTADGLPVGLQLVGKPWHDFEVMQLAHAFEQASEFDQPQPYGR